MERFERFSPEDDSVTDGGLLEESEIGGEVPRQPIVDPDCSIVCNGNYD